MSLVLTTSLVLAGAVAQAGFPEGWAYASHVLQIAGERPLSVRSSPSLRIVVVPSFGDVAILRFEEREGHGHLVLKTLCPEILPEEGQPLCVGEGTCPPSPVAPPRCEPNSLLRNEDRRLSPSQWESVQEVARAGFWLRTQLPWRPAPPNMVSFFDGTTWMVEGLDGSVRHFMRHSSLEDPVVRRFICRVSELAGVQVETGECK